MKISAMKTSFTIAAVFLLFVLIAPDALAAGCCKVGLTDQEFDNISLSEKASGCAGSVAAGAGIGSIVPGAGTAVGGVAGYYNCKAQTYHCYDSDGADQCAEEQKGSFSNESCDNISTIWCYTHEEKSYEPEGVPAPGLKVLNPACWPEDECDFMCKAGPDRCWGQIQPADCPPEYHYCYAESAGLDISVPIGGVTSVRDVGSYIALLYNYLIGVAVIVAIAMIMYGGFRWVTAAGDSGKISEAKKTIVGAVVGLVLALFSYTLLNTINPALVRLEMPKIKMIRQILFEIPTVRCSDYHNEQDCGVNAKQVQLDAGGCIWKTFGNMGAQCTTQDPQPGDSGTVCDSGGCVEGVDCLSGKVRYMLGPIASNYTDAHRWCTNHEMDSPCDKDSDCHTGLYCDKNIKACVRKDCCRPPLAECDNPEQCSSGLCEAGMCGRGDELRNCGASADPMDGPDDDKCGTGYKCETFGQKQATQTWQKWICCGKYEPRYECAAQCRDDKECGSLPNDPDEFCWKIGQTVRFMDSAGKTVTARLGGYEGHCLGNDTASGYTCMLDKECKSGTCADKRFFEYTTETVSDYFEKNTEILPQQYTSIELGVCE